MQPNRFPFPCSKCTFTCSHILTNLFRRQYTSAAGKASDQDQVDSATAKDAGDDKATASNAMTDLPSCPGSVDTSVTTAADDEDRDNEDAELDAELALLHKKSRHRSLLIGAFLKNSSSIFFKNNGFLSIQDR